MQRIQRKRNSLKIQLQKESEYLLYLNFQKYEEHEVLTGPGQVAVRPPPQPNLSMHRRTPEALLNQVERWHGRLSTMQDSANRYFRPILVLIRREIKGLIKEMLRNEAKLHFVTDPSRLSEPKIAASVRFWAH